MQSSAKPSDPFDVGLGPRAAGERYELLGEIATGGMATVYFGRMRGALGFARAVAIKSMHLQLAKDPTFRAMFIDEAHLTARIRHPNVVPTLGIVATPNRLILVMEYVEGVRLGRVARRSRRPPSRRPEREPRDDLRDQPDADPFVPARADRDRVFLDPHLPPEVERQARRSLRVREGQRPRRALLEHARAPPDPPDGGHNQVKLSSTDATLTARISDGTRIDGELAGRLPTSDALALVWR